MNDNILEPNFNGLPKPTDWNKVIVPLQQANEKEMRGATLPELGANLKIEMSVNAQRVPSVPPGALPEGPPDLEVFMEIKEPGSWTWESNPPLTNAQGNIATFWWDKTDWKKNDSAALPTLPVADEVIEGGNKATSQDAVFKADKIIDKKISQIIVNSDGVRTEKNIISGGVLYPTASTIPSWGFPTLADKNVSDVTIKLKAQSAANSQRLIVRYNDRSGTKLVDKTFNHEITTSAAGAYYLFDFSDQLIENINNNRLWMELYCNGAVSVFRIVPAVVFTAAAGYPYVRWTTANDLGITQVINGDSNPNNYYEIDHKIGTRTTNYDVSEWFEGKMINTISENPVAPSDVQDASDLVNQHFQYELKDTGNKYTAVDTSTGPQNNNMRRISFPIGKLMPFDILELPFYFLADGTKTRPTTITVTVKDYSHSGNVLETSTVPFPTSGGTGIYWVPVFFNKIIDSDKKLYLELQADGDFGLYRRYPDPTKIFTEANGYLPFLWSTSLIGSWTSGTYYDFQIRANIYSKKLLLKGVEIENVENKVPMTLVNENLRFSFTGSSVTWGDGFLQSGYVTAYINWIQTKVATSITAGDIYTGTMLSNRQYFGGKAVRLDGAGQSIDFDITGNEVSIVQAIERSNIAASEIEVYIDNILHDTINNYNQEPIGHEVKSIVGNGIDFKHDLQRAFTYNHTLTVNGQAKVIVMNMNASTGFIIPTNADAAIVRMNGSDLDGNRKVTHCLWFKTAPASGDEITIKFDYGKNLFYEKTSVGQDANGLNECPYGDGTVVFDPTAGATSIGSGLDFRQTDERVVKTYRFLEEKTRKVKLVVKGNYNGSTGVPYFIFNFATNRYFHFQNAGIGGWDLWDLDVSFNTDPFRNWQSVIEFNPDRLVIETTPNDDWIVKGHKLFNTTNVNLNTLRGVKNLPLRSIDYQSGTDSYDLAIWRGKITAITNVSVSFEGNLTTAVIPGDIIMIGQYWANNNDYIERIVSSVGGSTLYFDKPISTQEIIYNSLQDFIGKEIGIRDYTSFRNKLTGIIDKIRNNTNCPIYLLENPMPNILARELWGYPIVMDQISNSKQNVYSINYGSLRKWQNSQPKTSVVINTSAAVFDPYLNKKVMEFGNVGQNILAVDILVNGKSIYGKKAVVQNGWAYVVNQTATGTSLNKSAGSTTNANQIFNGRKPKLVLLDDALTGNVTIVYSIVLWSADSCHMNPNSAILYADFLKNI